MKRLLVLSLVGVAGAALADPFQVTGTGGNIPDNNTTGFNSNANFSGPAGFITGITSVVLFNLTHTWVGDLRAHISFGGQRFTLFQRPAGDNEAGTTFGDASDFGGNYTFDVVSATTIEAAATGQSATFVIPSGSYRAARQTNELATTAGPNSVFSSGSVFNGLDPNGTWTLTIVDGAGGDTGSVGDWQVNGTYSAVPEPATLAVLGVGALALMRKRRK